MQYVTDTVDNRYGQKLGVVQGRPQKLISNVCGSVGLAGGADIQIVGCREPATPPG